jgi:hypothetical protein
MPPPPPRSPPPPPSPPPGYVTNNFGCPTYSTGGLNYRTCFNQGGAITQSKPSTWFTSGWSITIGKNMAWNAGSNVYTFNGGANCGSPATPRRGTVAVRCARSTYINVFESSLTTSTGAVACNNCCNYEVIFYSPSGC